MSEHDIEIDFFPGEGFPVERTPEEAARFEWIITSLVILSDKVKDPEPEFISEFKAAEVQGSPLYTEGTSIEDFMIVPGEPVEEEVLHDEDASDLEEEDHCSEERQHDFGQRERRPGWSELRLNSPDHCLGSNSFNGEAEEESKDE